MRRRSLLGYAFAHLRREPAEGLGQAMATLINDLLLFTIMMELLKTVLSFLEGSRHLAEALRVHRDRLGAAAAPLLAVAAPRRPARQHGHDPGAAHRAAACGEERGLFRRPPIESRS
jgi:hypothetical protein